MRASVKKTIVFEPNISTYAGRDSLKGYVKSFEVDVQPSRELGLELFAKNLKNLKSDNVSEKADYLPISNINDIIEQAEQCPYGTLYVVSSLKTLDSFPMLKHLPINLNEPHLRNFSNCVVLVLTGGDLSGFDKIIYLDNPLYGVKQMKTAKVFVNKDMPVKDILPPLDATREGVGKVFATLRVYDRERADNSTSLYYAIGAEVPEISRYQFVFAVEVLVELGIIRFENGRMRYDKTVKTDINSSKIFAKISGRG